MVFRDVMKKISWDERERSVLMPMSQTCMVTSLDVNRESRLAHAYSDSSPIDVIGDPANDL